MIEDVDMSDAELRTLINTYDTIVLFWRGGADGFPGEHGQGGDR